MWKYALIFLWLFSGTALAAPVVFDGEGLIILHDGSSTAFNPHKEFGRTLLMLERESCCVEVPKNWHGPSGEFNFQANEARNLPHESKRFVLNPGTGAFVSTTSLQNPHYPVTDARRYVDGDITPSVALSDKQVAQCGCKLGDRIEITEPKSGAKVWAVYANDAGAQKEGLAFTQISPAAAAALNIPLDPDTKEPRSRSWRLRLQIYPGSSYGDHFPYGAVPPVKDAS